MSNEVHEKLKLIDEETIDNMPEQKLKLLEGIEIKVFVDRFYEEIKPYIPFPINRIPEDKFLTWLEARLGKMYDVMDKENLDEFFEFIKSGEVFSLTTYDEIMTWELKQDTDKLKKMLENVKGTAQTGTEFKLDPVLKDKNSPLKNQNNLRNKSRNPVDKYDELDTAMKVKEVTKGLAGLNTGNLKKESNIISKKMIDDYNNNLRSDTIDGSARKSKWVPTTNRNFFEENRLKIKAREWENKEKE